MYATNKFSIQIQLKENLSVQRFSVVGITPPPLPEKSYRNWQIDTAQIGNKLIE